MKNRWIRTALLFVMSFTLSAPLTAMNTNAGIDAQTMVAAVTQEAQQLTTDPVPTQQETQSNPPTTPPANPNAAPGLLSRGWNEFKGLTGFTFGLASWPFRYMGNDVAQSSMPVKKSALWAFIAFSIGCIAKQGYDLHNIDTKIGASELETASGATFLFGSWKYDIEGYRTASEIKDQSNADEIKRLLWQEVKKSGSRIHILGLNIRINPKNVTRDHLTESLQQEKIKLEGYLKTISYLTDVPKKILELTQQSSDKSDESGAWYEGIGKKLWGTNNDSYTWYQNAAFSPLLWTIQKSLTQGLLGSLVKTLKKYIRHMHLV